MLAPLLESVPFRTGAGAAMAFATAWRALVSRGELSLGDACLVHGASSGVGHAAAAGSDVVGTAREGDPTSLVRSLGADGMVDYRSKDLADELAAVTDGCPLDVVFEPHADSNLGTDLARLARGGKIVVIGENSPITLDGDTSMTAKQADADLRFMSIVASPDDQAPILRRVRKRLADGVATVEIDRMFELDGLSGTHVHSPGALGKVVADTQS
jgi:NADPH2:quinone reductase